MSKKIITRIWHGRIKAIHADEYQQYVVKTGISDYKSVKGMLGAEVLRRFEGDICHIWTVTKWEDYESIKVFAGENYTKARYYEKDKEYLLEFENEVKHCETFSF